MKRKTSAFVVFSLKLAITIGLIGYLLSKVDIAPVLTQIRSMQPARAMLGVFVMAVQLVLISVRWQLVNKLIDARTHMGQVLRLTLIGQFFNQVLPSAMGGDAVRAWLASREGVPLGRAVTGIVCDRAVGLIILVLIITGTFFVVPAIVPHQLPVTHAFRGVALIGMAGLAVLFFLGVPLARLLMTFPITQGLGKMVRDLRIVLYSPLSVLILALAAAVQILVVVAVYLCAQAMNIRLDFGAALLMIPAIMLVSTIPISFAGWGLREGAMIFGLGLLDVAPAEALAVSVSFGLLQIVIGLPGGVLWLTRGSAARGELEIIEAKDI